MIYAKTGQSNLIEFQVSINTAESLKARFDYYFYSFIAWIVIVEPASLLPLVNCTMKLKSISAEEKWEKIAAEYMN